MIITIPEVVSGRKTVRNVGRAARTQECYYSELVSSSFLASLTSRNSREGCIGALPTLRSNAIVIEQYTMTLLLTSPASIKLS
jgi:hypothetical protein